MTAYVYNLEPNYVYDMYWNININTYVTALDPRLKKPNTSPPSGGTMVTVRPAWSESIGPEYIPTARTTSVNPIPNGIRQAENKLSICFYCGG
jgi:hypothetical protein